MHIAILGQPLSGKSTVYEALTAAVSDPVGTGPSLTTVKVPDPRLDQLTEMYRPRRTVPADVSFADVRITGAGFSKSEGLSASYIDQLNKADALLLVVRAFQDESVPHLEGSVDPWRDFAAMQLELAFTDQILLSKRIERIEATIGKVKPAEREVMDRERALLSRLLNGLEKDQPIRDQMMDDDEAKLIRHYRFLTEKPLMVVVNVGEDQIGNAGQFETALAGRLQGNHLAGDVIAAKIERELVQLAGDDAVEFRESLGLVQPARDRILQLAYRLLGLIAFFTVGPDECRAWTIEGGTQAQKAAGAIHSDIERGFIRAEVVHYDDLISAGSHAEAKRHGTVRLEGKQYVVRDGDIIEYLFNV